MRGGHLPAPPRILMFWAFIRKCVFQILQTRFSYKFARIYTVFLQIFTGLHGFAQIHTDSHGFTRIYTNCYKVGARKNCADTDFVRIYTDLHKLLIAGC